MGFVSIACWRECPRRFGSRAIKSCASVAVPFAPLAPLAAHMEARKPSLVLLDSEDEVDMAPEEDEV